MKSDQIVSSLKIDKTTKDLILEIEKKDRRFRFAQSAFMFTVIAMVALGAFFLYGAFLEQQRQRQQATENINQSIENKIDEVKDQIDCFAKFFQAKDRVNLVLESDDKCDIKQVGRTTDNSNSVGSSEQNKNLPSKVATTQKPHTKNQEIPQSNEVSISKNMDGLQEDNQNEAKDDRGFIQKIIDLINPFK